MSASDVLTTLRSFSSSLDALERARQQIMRDGELDEIDLLALDVLELSLSFRITASLPLEKSPTMTAVVSTPPAAGIDSASMLVMVTASKAPAVY